MDKSGIRLQKQLAMGGELPTGNFGVDQFGSGAVNGPGESGSKYLGDHERAAKPPIKGNQANPDHGFPR